MSAITQFPAEFTFEIAFSSFRLSDTTNIYGRTYQKAELEMVFPNGSILKFSQPGIPAPTPGDGNVGSDSSAILMSLDENTASSRVYSDSIEAIKEDTVFAPESFTLLGENKSFGYNAFPSGVYRIKYTLYTNTMTYYGESVVLNTVPVDKCILNATDELISINCDEDECNDHKEALISKAYTVIALKEGAKLSFEIGDLNKASLKLRAADKICVKGLTNCNCND